jgi:hypothetical protein
MVGIVVGHDEYLPRTELQFRRSSNCPVLICSQLDYPVSVSS